MKDLATKLKESLFMKRYCIIDKEKRLNKKKSSRRE